MQKQVAPFPVAMGMILFCTFQVKSVNAEFFMFKTWSEISFPLALSKWSRWFVAQLCIIALL